jgi:hypothetical protein
MSEKGACVEIAIRNFAKKQGLDSARRGVSRSQTPHSASFREESERRGEERGRRTAPAPLDLTTGNGAAKPEPVPVDVPSPALVDHLLKTAQPRLGEVSRQDVADWLADVAPKMRDRGQRNLARAAVNWWPRCTPEELKRARANGNARRLEPIRREAESRPVEEVPPEAYAFEVPTVG